MFGTKTSTVSTDPQAIEEFLSRSIENIFPDKENLRKALLSGKRLSFYFGIDPTGPSIHIGHLIPLLSLRRLQDLGHEIILLIGDFTAMIGDPTDKAATRKALTSAEVNANLKSYKEQASRIIRFGGRNPARIAFNSKWLSKMDFTDVLDLASEMTVQQMLARDMFAKRVAEGKPIHMHEFLYPLMQGYDSVALGVDGEVGGNDQTFNMLAGRDLLKTRKNKEKFVVATKLLADPTGKKMGKSEGNMVALSDSPSDVYGKVMSWPDGMILPAMEYATLVPLKDIASARERMEKGGNPKEEKMRLAFAVTELCHGAEAAKEAEASFKKAFEDKGVPENVSELSVASGSSIADALLGAEIVESKAELRRLIESGAVTDLISGNKLSIAELAASKDMDLKIGKHRFAKIRIKK